MKRPSPVRRPGFLIGAATVLVLLLPGLVAAHAELQTSSPKDTEIVPGTPPEIWGTYSEAVKVDGSSLVLQDAGSGKAVATGGVDPADDKRMVITPVPELVPGDYIVKSTTVSADDNDIDRKQWIFTVTAAASASPSAAPTASPTASASPSEAPSPSPSASASASTSASPTITPAPSPSGSGSDTSSGSDVLLPILVALVLLAVLGGYLYTRRGSSTTPKP